MFSLWLIATFFECNVSMSFLIYRVIRSNIIQVIQCIVIPNLHLKSVNGMYMIANGSIRLHTHIKTLVKNYSLNF